MFCATTHLDCHKKLRSVCLCEETRFPPCVSLSIDAVATNKKGSARCCYPADLRNEVFQSIRALKGSRSPTPVGIAYRPIAEPIPPPAPQHERLRSPVLVPYMLHYTCLPACVVAHLCHVFRRYLCRPPGIMQTVRSDAALCICVSKVHGNVHIWNLSGYRLACFHPNCKASTTY